MDRRVQNQTNLRKSNETVPNQTELFEHRRRCPIYQEEPSDTRRKLLKWDVKWNVESVWNQTGNVKNRTKIFKIARKCPKSPVSQLFRGKKITVPAIKASDGLEATKHFLYTASNQVAKTHFMALTWPIIVNIGAGCPGQTADLR